MGGFSPHAALALVTTRDVLVGLPCFLGTLENGAPHKELLGQPPKRAGDLLSTP
jgi:hypothetical protein